MTYGPRETKWLAAEPLGTSIQASVEPPGIPHGNPNFEWEKNRQKNAQNIITANLYKTF